MQPQHFAVLLAHAVVGWAACGTVMGLSLASMSERRAIQVHALAVPPIFGSLSWVYFTWFSYTGPAVTAAAFVTVAIILDVVVVALLVQRSFEMFRSFAGVWLPMILIALVTLGVGYLRGA